MPNNEIPATHARRHDITFRRDQGQLSPIEEAIETRPWCDLAEVSELFSKQHRGESLEPEKIIENFAALCVSDHEGGELITYLSVHNDGTVTLRSNVSKYEFHHSPNAQIFIETTWADRILALNFQGMDMQQITRVEIHKSDRSKLYCMRGFDPIGVIDAYPLTKARAVAIGKIR